MEAEVVIRFRVKLEPGDDWAEEFADALQYQFGDIIEDVEVVEVEEV